MAFLRSLLGFVGSMAVALAAGFLVFVASLPGPAGSPRAADAIVALTGGEQRIEVALALLGEGKGRRLLISGLHPDTMRADIAGRDGATAFLDCCIDLDWIAKDTEGNAAEAARWARSNSFHRIIVVTANYHMPRALLELNAVMPEAEWVPYPVVPTVVATENWWQDGNAVRVLGSEYMKLIAAGLRLAGDWLVDSVAV